MKKERPSGIDLKRAVLFYFRHPARPYNGCMRCLRICQSTESRICVRAAFD